MLGVPPNPVKLVVDQRCMVCVYIESSVQRSIYTMAVGKVQIKSVQTVVPLRPSERKAQSVQLTKDVQRTIFSRRFHVIVYYNKASDDDSGWVTGGWMKETLGQALMDHPMLSGRLLQINNHTHDGNNEFMEIVSNDSGVRFYQARVCSTSLRELLETIDNELEAELVFWEDIDQQNPQFSPLCYVQVHIITFLHEPNVIYVVF